VNAPILSRRWLDLEILRIWLIAERELRRMQALQVRPSPAAPAVAEVEALLSQRRAMRRGGPAPISTGEIESALDSVMTELAPLRAAAELLLAQRLELSAGDVEALLWVAAPSIDPALADLFAVIRGASMGRRGVDLALIGQMVASQPTQRVELLDVIEDGRPPLLSRLIQVAPTQDVYASAAYRSIQPTLDLLWVLTTDGSVPSPSLRQSACVQSAPASWAGLLFDQATLASLEPLRLRWAAARGDKPALAWAALWGAVGSGKREVASRLAACSGRAALCADPTRVAKEHLADFVRRAARDASWIRAALYVGPMSADALLEQASVVSELEQCAVPVALGFDGLQAPRIKTAHPLGEHGLRLPLAPTRLALWARELAEAPTADDLDLDGIAAGYKLTPGEIIQSAREAISLAGPRAIDNAALREVLERRLRNELGAIATRLVVNTSWDDVILPEEAASRVRELIARKRFEDRVYRQWDLDRSIGYGKGIVALFSGPPGTGKTLLAGLIAKELGFELYQVDLSQIFSRWIGETEKALGKVFDQAERAHAVLLFDEADALFAKRTEVEDSRDRYANVAVNFLLQRLERYSGVAVLTTNKDSYLDEALRRRLSLHLQLEEPEVAERLRLWRKHLPPLVPGSDTVDIAALASDYELTGGYIKNVAVRATFFAAAEGVPLSTEQVQRAAILELEDMGRVVTWPGADVADAAFDTDDYIEG
jgi:AAA+ superfamily predicted ATPase